MPERRPLRGRRDSYSPPLLLLLLLLLLILSSPSPPSPSPSPFIPQFRARPLGAAIINHVSYMLPINCQSGQRTIEAVVGWVYLIRCAPAFLIKICGCSSLCHAVSVAQEASNYASQHFAACHPIARMARTCGSKIHPQSRKRDHQRDHHGVQSQMTMTMKMTMKMMSRMLGAGVPLANLLVRIQMTIMGNPQTRTTYMVGP